MPQLQRMSHTGRSRTLGKRQSHPARLSRRSPLGIPSTRSLPPHKWNLHCKLRSGAASATAWVRTSELATAVEWDSYLARALVEATALASARRLEGAWEHRMAEALALVTATGTAGAWG